VFGYPRFPYATAILALAMLVPYFMASQGTLYLSDEEVFLSSFSLSQVAGLVTHLFTHVGAFHLAGNLVPLILFTLLLETMLSSLSVFALFLTAGIFSSIVFSLLNPGAYLVGSSAAVSSLMAAATALKPKYAVFMLIATPLLISFFVFPAVSALITSEQEDYATQQALLQIRAQSLAEENKTIEAAAANASANAYAQKVDLVEKGRERESQTQTDFFVHFYGALYAVLFLAAFKRPELDKGALEFSKLHAAARGAWAKFRGRA